MVSRRAFLSLVAGSMSASRVALAQQEACKVALYANVVSDLTYSRWHGYCSTPPRSLLIPGTSSVAHLRENIAATNIKLPADAVDELDRIGAC